MSISNDFGLVNEDCACIDVIAASGISDENVAQIATLTGTDRII